MKFWLQLLVWISFPFIMFFLMVDFAGLFLIIILILYFMFTVYMVNKSIKLKKWLVVVVIILYFCLMILVPMRFTPNSNGDFGQNYFSELSNSEPIQIAKNKMDMVYNGKNSFLIKVKNTAFKDLGQAKPVISCNVDDNYQTISMKTSTERMLINQTNKFDGVVNINEKENSFLKLGFMYPCKIYIYDGGLEVNSIKPKLFFVEIIQK